MKKTKQKTTRRAVSRIRRNRYPKTLKKSVSLPGQFKSHIDQRVSEARYSGNVSRYITDLVAADHEKHTK